MSTETDDRRFSAAEERSLARVLDEVIPPSGDGRLPGAGEVGLAARLGGILAATPGLRDEVVRGLAGLDGLARERGAESFAELSAEQRSAVLAESESSGGSLRSTLLFPTFIAYYQEPRVLEGLGIEPRPPFPLGYELAPFDESLLEPVRRRAKMYRDC